MAPLLMAALWGIGSSPAMAERLAPQEQFEGLSFRSEPHLRPPAVTLTVDSAPGSGDVFLAPVNSYQRRVLIEHGPMILDPHGGLIWFDPVNGIASNFSVQTYRSRPVLTWWQQLSNHVGEDVIMNSSYRTVAVLRAAHGYSADGHEFQITPQGTALVEAYVPVKRDLASIGGSRDGVVDDCVIQELAIPSGRLLWEWHSLGHIPLRDSYLRPTGHATFDYFHLNSIQQLPSGDLLISARHTWGVYEINRRTGRVIWELGGKHSSFSLGPGAHFSWQHDARLAGGTLSLFDDGTDGPSRQESQSSVKFLRLDLHSHPMRATLVRRYTHTPALSTISQGNAQLLPNHDVVVGWGADPEFSEYSPSGRQILEGSFAVGVNSYRAYRFDWTGDPGTRPSVAASGSSGAVTVYASWNGATRVARWLVRAGTDPHTLAVVASAGRTGFETTIGLSGHPSYVAVEALDSAGTVLGSSATVAVSTAP